jgi:hypothetical protein
VIKSASKGRSVKNLILLRVESIGRDALSAGPSTNPMPSVAIIRPRYFGLSSIKEESATPLCMIGMRSPKDPEIMRESATATKE